MSIEAASLSRLRVAFERSGALPEGVWQPLCAVWKRRPFHRKEVLTAEGEQERYLGFILDGVQRLYFTTPGGDEVTVAFTYEEGLSGVPDSFFLGVPSAYTLEALTDGKMLVAHRDAFMLLVDTHPELARWAWQTLAAAGQGRGKREREQLTLTAEQRYTRLLGEAPHLVHRVPLRHLASYLGMTPETLSRVRARPLRRS